MTPLDDILERLRREAQKNPEETAPPARPWANERQIDAPGHTQTLLNALAEQARVPYPTLLALDEDDFTRLAYRLLLARAPDPSGLAHYRQRLARGETRAEMLVHLAGSDEARGTRQRITGLRWAVLLVTARRVAPRPLDWLLAGGARVLERRLAARASSQPTALLWRQARQLDARQAADHRLADLNTRLDGTVAELEARLDGTLAELEARLDSAREAQAVRADTLSQTLAEAQEHLTHLQAQVSALTLPAPADTSALTAPATGTDTKTGTAPPEGRQPETALDHFYYAFESVFRGPPGAIETQLRTDYLHRVQAARDEAGAGPCLDLGCGRGEWLRVLGAAGFAAHGVDLSPVMVAAARARGADARVGDALAEINNATPDSLLLISAFHLVEHLPFPSLFALLAACRRALKPEGLLILETPNPENVWVATHTFHHDPTHGQPLTPGMLEFLARHHGFQVLELARLHPYPNSSRLPDDNPAAQRLNGMLCGPQDFALVARKPRVASGAWTSPAETPACG